MQNRIVLLVMLAVSGPAAEAQQTRLLPVTVVNAGVDPAKPVDGALVQMTTLGGLNAGAHGKSLTNVLGKANVALGKAAGYGERQQIAVEPPTSAAELVVYEPADGLVEALPLQLTVKMLAKRSELLKGPAQVEARLRVLTLQNATLTQRNRALAIEVRQQGQKLAEDDGLTEAIEEWGREAGFPSEELERTVREWAEEIKRKGKAATLEQQALAELALRHYGEAAKDFQQSAAIDLQDAEAIDKKETEQRGQRWTKWEEKMEQSANAYQLDHNFEESSGLMQKASETLRAQHEAYPRDTQLRTLWLEANQALADALEWEGQSGHAWDASVLLKRSAALERAIRTWEELDAAYRSIGDREGAASMQCGLGDAYRLLAEQTGGQEGQRLLGKAVEALQHALEVQTKEKMPQDWASSLMKLGVAYFVQAGRTEGEESQRLLHEAVEAHQHALEVFSKDDVPPWAWAREQMNLGNAYDDLGERASGEEAHKLEGKAVEAYQHALEVETKEAAPQDWAETQRNLAISYRRQGEQSSGERAHKLLEKAVEASGHVLEVVRKEAQPHLWADTQMALTQSFLDLADWMEDAGRAPEAIQNLRLARKALESASEVNPDLQGAIQQVDSEIARVASGRLKEK